MSEETDIKIEGTIQNGSVEIKGVKIQATESNDKPLKIGDSVKILIKNYGDTYDSYPGIISHYDKFKELPAITVCYIEYKYSEVKVLFKTVTNASADVEIVRTEALDLEGLEFVRTQAVKAIEMEITKKKKEVADIEYKLTWFNQYFGKYFGSI